MHVRLALTCSLLLLSGRLLPAPAPPQDTPRLPVRLGLDDPRATVLIDRLPWLVAQPGRYELLGTLTMADDPVAEAATGIVIRSDDVVLDLGGHALIGSKGSATGILVEPPEKRTTPMLNVTVRNGSVRNWGGHGVDLGAAVQARVEGLALAGNGVAQEEFDGLVVGDGAIISRCSAQYNASAGIRVGRGAQLVACTGSYNGGSGLVLGAGGLARDCVAAGNAGDGMLLADAGCAAIDCSASGNGRHGISTGPAARVAGCTSWSNLGSGIRVEGHGLVQSCLAAENTGAGILVFSGGTRIDGNHLSGNGLGLDVAGSGNLVVRNSLAANTVTWSLPDGNVSGGLHELPSVAQTILALKPPGAVQQDEQQGPETLPAWTNFAH